MDGSWQTRKASADLSIFRRRSGVFGSILQWRTFILVNLARRGVHALSFPFKFSSVSFLLFFISDVTQFVVGATRLGFM